MEKTIKRLLLGDLSNIQEYEEYFSDMSRQGLHLDKIGGVFVHFKEGEPKNLKYRIDLAKDNKKEKKKLIETHREKGWNFVADRDPFLVFSAKQSYKLNELYETPEAQKMALIDAQEEYIKKDFKNVGWQGLSIITILTMMYFQIKAYGGLYLSLAEENQIYSFILITLIPFLTYGNKRKNLKKVEETLDSGEFLKHQGDYSWMNKKYIIKKIVIGIFILIGFFVLYDQVGSFEILDIDSTDNLDKSSIVTIKDIENYDEEKIKNSIDKVLFKDSSLFTPKNYRFIENLKFENIDENNKNSNTILEFKYYLNRFKFMSKGLERDILNREKKKYDIQLKEIKSENDSSIYSAQIENTIYLLIRREKEVIYLEYKNGMSSLDEIIEAVDKKSIYIMVPSI